MIRYAITKAKLTAEIEQTRPGWLAKAKQKTAAFKAAQAFNEPAKQNSWSEIKAVYMQLQHNKCAYCERKLGGQQFGKGEHDVEHYRPKNAVKAWPTVKMKKNGKYSYSFSTGDKTDKGYYLLAYNILNYTTACKSCNSSLKSNYFPIAGTRALTTTSFTKLKQEKPYLLYPISNLDDDPEDLLTFDGILPIPKLKQGEKHNRARVTIDFFALDLREDLNELRARIILHVWLAWTTLQDAQASAENKNTAQKIIELARSPRSEQTNCARAFYRLCQQDETLAGEFKKRAEQYLDSLQS